MEHEKSKKKTGKEIYFGKIPFARSYGFDLEVLPCRLVRRECFWLVYGCCLPITNLWSLGLSLMEPCRRCCACSVRMLKSIYKEQSQISFFIAFVNVAIDQKSQPFHRMSSHGINTSSAESAEPLKRDAIFKKSISLQFLSFFLYFFCKAHSIRAASIVFYLWRHPVLAGREAVEFIEKENILKTHISSLWIRRCGINRRCLKTDTSESLGWMTRAWGNLGHRRWAEVRSKVV